MYTYLIYNAILFLSVLFAFVAQKSYQNNDKSIYQVFLSLSFLSVFIPAAIRYDIGTDYANYVYYFDLIKNDYFVPKEPLYILLNKVIALLGLDVQWFFVITSFIICYFVYKIIPIKHLPLGVFLYVVTLYLHDYSAVRQGIAVVLVTYAIRFLSEKRMKKFFLYTALASLVHIATGLGILLVYPIVRRNYNKYFLLAIIAVSYVLIVRMNITQLILIYVGNLIPKYSWYLTSEFNRAVEMSSGVGVLIRLFIAFIIVFFKDRIVVKNSKANIIINLYVLYVFAYLLNLDVHIFERFRHIYQFFSILAVLYFVEIFDKYSRRMVAVGIALVFYLFFMKDINVDRKSVHGGLGINPYTTILDK